MLAAAGIGDAITLANLAVLVAGDGSTQISCSAPCTDRDLVLNRLAELSPPPEGVTVHGAVTDPALLERWRETIVLEQIVRSLEDGAPPKK